MFSENVRSLYPQRPVVCHPASPNRRRLHQDHVCDQGLNEGCTVAPWAHAARGGRCHPSAGRPGTRRRPRLRAHGFSAGAPGVSDPGSPRKMKKPEEHCECFRKRSLRCDHRMCSPGSQFLNSPSGTGRATPSRYRCHSMMVVGRPLSSDGAYAPVLCAGAPRTGGCVPRRRKLGSGTAQCDVGRRRTGPRSRPQWPRRGPRSHQGFRAVVRRGALLSQVCSRVEVVGAEVRRARWRHDPPAVGAAGELAWHRVPSAVSGLQRAPQCRRRLDPGREKVVASAPGRVEAVRHGVFDPLVAVQPSPARQLHVLMSLVRWFPQQRCG